MLKLYKSKPWLERKYVHEKKTITEIAEICDVSHVTIYNHLKKAGLLRDEREWRKR